MILCERIISGIALHRRALDFYGVVERIDYRAYEYVGPNDDWTQ